MFTSATLSPPGWVGESGSLQVDVALDGVELEPGRGVAVDLWLPVYHLKDPLGLQMCSFSNYNSYWTDSTWTSITLMSIRAVTEIPIIAPPFKTRTATYEM